MADRNAIMADRKSRSVSLKIPVTATLGELKAALLNDNSEAKLTVIQALSGGDYLAEFERKEDAEDLIENGVDYKELHIQCHPPHGYYINVSIIGLKAYISDEKVLETLQGYGETKSKVIRLKYKNGRELEGLENGNRLVRMVLTTPSIPYSIKIDGEYCRIIHNDQQRVCSDCQEVGHSRRKCPYIECRMCGLKGHLSYDCKSYETPTAADLDNSAMPDDSGMTADNDTPTNTESAENIPENIKETPQEETPPPLESLKETEPPIEDATMTEEERKRSGVKRPHQTDSEPDNSDKAPMQRRARTRPVPNLDNSRHRHQPTEQEQQQDDVGKPPT